MRGCERKIIMLKGTDSQIFDEAYFLLRRDIGDTEDSEGIVSEAQRIVAGNTIRRRNKYSRKKEIVYFTVGLFIGIIAAALFTWIF